MAEASQGLAQGGGAPANPLLQYVGEKGLRQLGLIAGLALAIAAGIWLFMWGQEPVYRQLYGQLEQQDASAVMDALQAAGIPYQVDPNSGAILLPADQIHQARLKLAAQGLPKSGGLGYELLQQDQGFGTSQFIQNARFYRALETELARSISSINTVQAARVHLAVPKQSVFVRERSEPRASVVVNLHSGRSLTEGQVAAIVHLVASSVANLAEENVTLVDEAGALLTQDEQGLFAGSTKQFEYKQQIEQAYAERITRLLEPMMGPDRVRAQVNASLDFSVQESTQELYDPEGAVIRSEQTSDEQLRGAQAGGVPGALANQPPQAGTLAEGEQAQALGEELSTSRAVTRNYEISKTIRHVRQPQGQVERLSVAVLVDEITTTDANGNTVREPLPQARIDQITALVKQTIGFDAARGDSVDVINAPFRSVAEEEQVVPVEPPLWEQPWAVELGKGLLAALVGLVLILFIGRPLILGLLGRDRKPEPKRSGEQPQLENEGGEVPQLAGPEAQQLMNQQRDRLKIEGNKNSEEIMAAAREVVTQEPALAANVVKNWLAQDD